MYKTKNEIHSFVRAPPPFCLLIMLKYSPVVYVELVADNLVGEVDKVPTMEIMKRDLLMALVPIVQNMDICTLSVL